MADVSSTVKSLIKEGYSAQDEGNLQRAKDKFSSAVEAARKEKDLASEARALLELGAVNASLGEDRAMAHVQLERCLKLYTTLRSDRGRAYAMSNLGTLAFEEKDFGVALEWQMKALRLFEKEQDQYGIAMAHHQIGLIESQQTHYQSAEKHWRQSLLIFESLGRNFGVGQALLSLGVLYADYHKDPEQARLLYSRALTVFEKAGLSYEAEKARHNLARLPNKEP